MPLKELPENHNLTHLRWALEHVENFGVAIDGGAHQGIWTRELLKRFDQVIAFEPVESNRRLIPQGAHVYPYALGDKNGTVDMEPGKNNTGQYHVTPGATHTMVALDGFKIVCDFLKLDVEGYELKALQGAEELLNRCKPVVMIEDNGLCERYGVQQMDSDKYLKSLGYSCLGFMNPTPTSRDKDYLYKHV